MIRAAEPPGPEGAILSYQTRSPVSANVEKGVDLTLLVHGDDDRSTGDVSHHRLARHSHFAADGHGYPAMSEHLLTFINEKRLRAIRVGNQRRCVLDWETGLLVCRLASKVHVKPQQL